MANSFTTAAPYSSGSGYSGHNTTPITPVHSNAPVYEFFALRSNLVERKIKAFPMKTISKLKVQMVINGVNMDRKLSKVRLYFLCLIDVRE